jgi:hypothetical protein
LPKEFVMAKMFYSTDEVTQKLGVDPDQLKQLVSSNKLREFRDGARVMFKVDQVDKLAADKGATKGGSAMGDSGIALSGDSHASDVISLADSTTGVAKDDTVVTGQGINVLETGEMKSPADTAAQTKIQSAIDDQLSLEGVGSGSGLLDLTRESDDTSLGAELLDEIYPGGDSKGDSSIASASGIFEQSTGSNDTSGPSGLENIAAASTVATVTPMVEMGDPSAGAFGGLAFASLLIMIVTAILVIAFVQGFSPGWAEPIYQSSTNIIIFGAALLVISALFAGIGFFAGKARAE